MSSWREQILNEFTPQIARLTLVADVLTYLKGLKPKNLLGAAFGSFGWSGEAVGHINDFLRAMKVELVSEGVKSNYVPNRKSLDECYSLGVDLARKMKERC